MFPGASIILWLKVAAVAAVGIGLLWLVDEIGDRREAKVWKKINSAIEKTNVDVRKHNDLDEKIWAIAEEARGNALEAAKQIESDRFKLTSDQAAALNRIK